MIARWLAAQAIQSVKQAAQEEIVRKLNPDVESSTSNERSAGEHIACEDHGMQKNEPVVERTNAQTTDIGFVFAMPMEAAGVTDRLKEKKTIKANGRIFHAGRFGQFQVAIVESGVGQQRAEQATKLLIETFSPRRIVSAGYGGGLHKRLKRFSVCFPEIIIRESDGMVLDISAAIPQLAPKRTGPIRDKLGLLTCNFVAASPKQKTELYRNTGAEIVDMETFAVADLCRLRNVPFLAVRIILDTVDEQLPKDVQNILKSAEIGRARLAGSVLGSLFKRPSAILDLFSLKERALSATDRLAKRLVDELTSNKN